MTVDELIALAEEWRVAQIGCVVNPTGSARYKECLKKKAEVQSRFAELRLEITTDDWANVVIKLPFKL